VYSMEERDDADALVPVGPVQAPARHRPLVVDVFGVPRELGTLPAALHSDVRTTVLGLTRIANGRGKPISLSHERAAAVDEALRRGGAFAGGTMELQTAIMEWRADCRAAVDASGINAYYDAWRAEGYTSALGGAQDALTRRCAELTGLSPRGDAPLLLDLGCGSGLSIQPLEAKGFRVIGVDLSIEMLRTARRAGAEVVQADISRPLPFRSAVFDSAISVSALQFLCEPDTRNGIAVEERLRTCFSHLRRVVTAGEGSATATGLQFHPADAEADPRLVLAAARAEGCVAALVLDQPHHTSAKRWFAYVAAPPPIGLPSSTAAESSSVLDTNGANCGCGEPAICGMHAPLQAPCLLTLQQWVRGRSPASLPLPVMPADHVAWLELEHVRLAHKLLRYLRRVEAQEDRDRVRAVEPTDTPSELPAGDGDAPCTPSANCGASGLAVAGHGGPSLVGGRKKRRKDKGWLAPGADLSGMGAAMSVAEREVASRLRVQLGIAPGDCPTLDELQARQPEVLRVLHGAHKLVNQSTHVLNPVACDI
jgi:SAM-dependent methyltransferase